MAVEVLPETAPTRASMVYAYRDLLGTLVNDGTLTVADLAAVMAEGSAQVEPAEGEDAAATVTLAEGISEAIGNVPVITRANLDAAIAAVFDQPIPAPSETAAEVRTPAYVTVAAVCPRCDIPQPILVVIRPELVISDDGAELKVKAKAKGRTHICGQLPLTVVPPVEGQESLPLEDAEACPIEGCESLERMAVDLSVEPEPGSIPIVGCGNPWHYVNTAFVPVDVTEPEPPAADDILTPEPELPVNVSPLRASRKRSKADTFGGLVEAGESLGDALRRLEARADYAEVIGSEDGQRLLEAINRGGAE